MLGAAGAVAVSGNAFIPKTVISKPSSRLALLGGEPVRKKNFPKWPYSDELEERNIVDVIRSGGWNRYGGKKFVKQFEEMFAEKLGARFCVTTNGGTTALHATFQALDIGPGDEVLVPVYTFVATIDVVFISHALPVFIDTDPRTYQINTDSLEDAITEHTRAIMPVHIGGSPANLDAVMAVARKHDLHVIEDTCQSVLGEWRNKKLGTIGSAGCFSFQGSKNLNCGEGGAVVGNSEEILRRCYAFQSFGREWDRKPGGFPHLGSNYKMTEFQAAVLLAQFSRLEEQTETRIRNAEYLTERLQDIPGLNPVGTYDGATRRIYHLYMLHYDKSWFANAPRAKFLEALREEGIPAASGYPPLNKEGFVEETIRSRAFQTIYSKGRLDEYRRRIACPLNDRLCEEDVWLPQNLLLGTTEDMDQVVEAVQKVKANAVKLV